jgi:delta24-sterol reductase
VHVTKDGVNSDLFYALPWSHGSLAILVAVELKVIPIKRYVRLTYLPISGAEQIHQAIREKCGATDPNAKVPVFCEATLYSKEKAVLTYGGFDDGKTPGDTAKVNALARWHKPWWYKHVEGYSKRNETGVELVPVEDYLLRHTRSIFWVIELMVPYGNHPIFRWLFGWLLPLDVTFMKFTTTSGVRKLTFMKQVFQDITLPMTEMEKSVDLCTECFDLWPLLIYPCKEFHHGEGMGQLRPPRPDQLCPGAEPKWGMFFDLGIYGAPGPVLRKTPFNPARAMRRFIDFVRQVGGHPFLYADNFFTEKEFEEMFDLTLWRKCRTKYHAEGNFPTLWEKVRSEVDVINVGDRTLFEDQKKQK